MFRRNFPRKNLGPQRGFRWRGGDVSRVEHLSDTVFAFALLLSIVSLDVPKTFSDVLTAMRGVVTLGGCFIILVWLWYKHYLVFRRYGLRDKTTVVINTALLFAVLLYVYPFKFLSGWLANSMMGVDSSVRNPDGTMLSVLEPGQGVPLVLIFNAGYFFVMTMFLLLYRHAIDIKDRIQLTELELADTKSSRNTFAVHMGMAALTSAIVLLGGEGAMKIAGFAYILLIPTLVLKSWLTGRSRAKLEERLFGKSDRQQGKQGTDQHAQPQREQRQQQGQQNQPRPQGQQRQQFGARREQQQRPPHPRRNPNEPPKE